MRIIKGKAAYILLGIIFVTAIILQICQLFSKEGSWVCVNGAWQMQGKTSKVKPIESCSKSEVMDNQKFVLEGEVATSTTTTTQEVTGDVPITYNQDKTLAIIEEPKANSVISSPLVVKGEAPGAWYFEASFPVKLLDDKGNVIATAPASAQSDSLTTDFVPYKTLLEFTTTATSGYLVLTNDNPSGLIENELSVKIPVTFLNK
jgi:Immunoglobulin-like domain of bacterial spore germination.